ncbi:MAG: DUF1003 domain-containing protein [Gammaproteobacteria bacterium]|jgi:uncharacterized membrane protein
MKKQKKDEFTCFVCQQSFLKQEVISGELVQKELAHEIKKIAPDWNATHFICHSDLALMRSHYIHSLLNTEKNELTSLERSVLKSIQEHELLSTDIEEEFDKNWTFVDKLTDKIAKFGGSWGFLICFGVFLTAWIITNSLILFLRPVDPYPFIFLNLILSCLTAMQAPVIMMSQNRHAEKDRFRSQHDYKVNLKAELEIRSLHEKIDHLLSHQWEKMVKIQEMQLAMLAELNSVKKARVPTKRLKKTV